MYYTKGGGCAAGYGGMKHQYLAYDLGETESFYSLPVSKQWGTDYEAVTLGCNVVIFNTNI